MRWWIAVVALVGCSIPSESFTKVPQDGPDGGSGGSGGSDAQAKLTRAHLTDVGKSSTPLEYSDPALWLCRPDIGDLNECMRNIDATEIDLDNVQTIVRHVASTSPTFDCFYVYPTVTFGQANDTDFSDVSDQIDALLGQAARFSRVCNVYTPLYRQVGLNTNGLPDPSANAALGLADVRAAFKYYLDNLNHGRPFVLLGHDQGAAVLTQMIRLDVEANGEEEVLNKMVSALLIGGNIRVSQDPSKPCTPGSSDCGSFGKLKPCTSSSAIHCVVAYSSYRVAAPPPANALFGAQTANTRVVCTAPSELVSSGAGLYIPTTVNNAMFQPQGGDAPLPTGINTPFVFERNKFTDRCVEKAFNNTTYNYMEITPIPMGGSDMRPIPPYTNPNLEALGYGEHVLDYEFETEALIRLVTLQALSLCAGGGCP